MNELMSRAIGVLYVITINIALPAVMIWGWVRWTKREKQWTVFSILSLIGFVLATASGLLAISSSLYALKIGGFPFFDPMLMRIYRWGTLLSATGIIFAMVGVWRPSSLRWHALISAAGTLMFWIASATGE
jgi:uncharacterized BrkB/YihY/UPF0761 family membrane protein